MSYVMGVRKLNVTGRVWLDLTQEERMICLEFASWQNVRRVKHAFAV